MMTRNSIDGVVLKKKKKSIDKIKEDKSFDDSDEGSCHNIFGSRDNVEISHEMKQKLGLK